MVWFGGKTVTTEYDTTDAPDTSKCVPGKYYFSHDPCYKEPQPEPETEPEAPPEEPKKEEAPPQEAPPPKTPEPTPAAAATALNDTKDQNQPGNAPPDSGPTTPAPKQQPQVMPSSAYLPVDSFPYPRVKWALTSELDLSMKTPQIEFFINPSEVTFNFPLRVGEQDQQGGHVFTFWQAPRKKSAGGQSQQGGYGSKGGKNSNVNFIPYMDIEFTMQLGNINPHTYASFVKQEGQKDKKEQLTIPQGVWILYRIFALLNQPKILVEDTEAKIAEGTPNYMYLSVSTRLFPHIVFKGFLYQGIQGLNETAEEPFLRTMGLQFRATTSIPKLYAPLDPNDLLTEYSKTLSAGYL